MTSILLDKTHCFVFDFVTCPCSSRTKRHDNLFVYDDDDDDDDVYFARQSQRTY